MQQIFKGQSVQTLLHDSVFSKMDKTAGLFKVVVPKTNSTLAYSSVFINLDCKYWSADKEKQLWRNHEQELKMLYLSYLAVQ